MTIQVPIALGCFELCTYKHVNRNVVAQDEVNFNMGNNNIQLIHSGIDQSLTAVSLVSSSETTFAYARPDCRMVQSRSPFLVVYAADKAAREAATSCSGHLW